MTERSAECPSRDECTLALVSHALSFVEGGVVGPLVMYVLREPIHEALFKDRSVADSEFVAFHSLQSLYFGLLFLAISLPLALATCGMSLLVTIPIYLIFEVIACMKANHGAWYPMPIVGSLAAQKHPPPGP